MRFNDMKYKRLVVKYNLAILDEDVEKCKVLKLALNKINAVVDAIEDDTNNLILRELMNEVSVIDIAGKLKISRNSVYCRINRHLLGKIKTIKEIVESAF